jgi:hypothetical protein
MIAEYVIASPLASKERNEELDAYHKETLGNVRLRHNDTNEVILIPTPSDNPNNPLTCYVFTVPH